MQKPFFLLMAALSVATIAGCSSNVSPAGETIATAAPMTTEPEKTASSFAPIEQAGPKNVVGIATSKAAQSIAWRKNFEAAQAEAAKSRKPLMVDFYADWCGACKMMDAEAYTNAELIRESQKFVMVKVDADQRTDLARKFNVTGLPTLLWLDNSGNVLHSSPGYGGLELLQNDMKSALSQFEPTV
ncbi:MAG TPA: protein disulfide isomerase family protein [Abditibacteriaceae bacterium]|nr:protein disulfide isomerase family protein [Abditibacteriaceae bacterium]